MFSSFHSLADKTNNETLTETIFLGHTRVALFKGAVSGECCCCRSILGAEVITSCFYPYTTDMLLWTCQQDIIQIHPGAL